MFHLNYKQMYYDKHTPAPAHQLHLHSPLLSSTTQGTTTSSPPLTSTTQHKGLKIDQSFPLNLQNSERDQIYFYLLGCKDKLFKEIIRKKPAVCYLYVWGRGGEEVLEGQSLTKAQGQEEPHHSHPRS